MDLVSEKQRSYNMSRIRGRNTKRDLLVRSMLHRARYRFTVNGPKNRKLSGRPDIVLPKLRTPIFVHGCFWQHEGCKDFRLPKTRTAWWIKKIEGNSERDRRHMQKRTSLGWRVLVVRECSLKAATGWREFGGLPEALAELESRDHCNLRSDAEVS